FNLSLTQKEIASAIKGVLPDSWAQARFQEVVYSMATYVKGESNSIAITIDLSDRKAAALQVLAETVDRKLSPLFSSLPTCSLAEFQRSLQNLPPSGIPSCRPYGVSYEQFKSMLPVSITDVLQQMVIDRIPDRWTYTDADIRRSMGVDNQEILDKARGWVQTGYTFTDADLKDELNSDEEETLEDIRGWIADGYTVDQTDLRDAISDKESDLDSFDDARSAIHSVRKWLWVIILIPFIVLIAIGFLAGRDWKGRVLWAFTTLFIASLIIYVALTVAYSHSIKPDIKDAFELSDKTGLELVLLEKGQEVAVNFGDSFFGGIKTRAIWTMIFSVLIVGGTIAWETKGEDAKRMIRTRRRRSGHEDQSHPISTGRF
ncbi:MAG: hypothetical protein PHV74_06260, partial [Dehalococcoidia bacterium]|nr:hypothetical protein [Dehalococcoidia bacterium]